MLEIKNVSKTYRPKKGVPVKALDNISLAFPDRGMVFILGKSGSGKSTLLNVLGGLDKADEGEFIIKGKSSKDFSQSDFDSYRNTFIGFIFQEYNILPEFTVGANIALAMELQGKKATREALNAILDQVDLTGYAGRKPNELSGGQKQRVAIARALIKEPEMIFADEPTGALDSATGKQVFDTLKKLSKDKLVVIVSHDRDFAELYADRIIELKDGVILSDVSKNSLPPTSVSEGVSVIDNKLIHVKKGYKLTKSDLDLINDYLARADGDALISVDEKKNDDIKKVVKMNDEGGSDAFLDTQPKDVPLKQYAPEDSKLIRSRLPYRNSLKIGASSLKVKPFRLMVTILLSFIAFTMFGLVDTMASYDRATVYAHSIVDRQIDAAAFLKQREQGDGSYSYLSPTLLSEADALKIQSESGVKVLPVYADGNTFYSYGSNGISFSSSLLEYEKCISPNSASYYSGSASGFVEADADDISSLGIDLVGRTPQTDDEIVITDYIYEHFTYAGLKDGNTEIEAADIGEPAEFAAAGHRFRAGSSYGGRERTFTIVGIAMTHPDKNKYADYLPDAQRVEQKASSFFETTQMSNMLTYGFHSLLFVKPGVVQAMISARAQDDSMGVLTNLGNNGWMNLVNDDGGNYKSFSAGNVAKLSQLNDTDAIMWTDGTPRTSLADNEIILPAYYRTYSDNGERTVKQATIEYIKKQFGDDSISVDSEHGVSMYEIERIIKEFSINNYVKEHADEYKSNEFRAIYEEHNGGSPAPSDAVLQEEYSRYLQGFYSDNGGYIKNAVPNGRSGILIARPYIRYIAGTENIKNDNAPSSGEVNAQYSVPDSARTFNVVGYMLPSADTTRANGNEPSLTSDMSYAIVSDVLYAAVTADAASYYSFAVGKMPSESSAVARIVDFGYTAHEGGVYYSLNNEISAMLEEISDLIETLSQVLLYVGIFLAVFASLMMFNFISVSISYKKREIGILRAVGARSGDVFGIFFNESLIMVLIDCLLAVVGTFLTAFFINRFAATEYGFMLTLLVVGVRQILLIFGIGVLVAFVSSFFPVMRIARKRPIDAIQDR